MSILRSKAFILVSVPKFGLGGTSHQTFHTTVSFIIFLLSVENGILKCNNVTFYISAPNVNILVIP